MSGDIENSALVTAKSFAWKFVERISVQVINFIIQILLARNIPPKDFGSLAIMIVFINMASIFVQKGLSSSLIRKKYTDETDYNTAFVTGLGIALALYLALFLASPFIAQIYNSNQVSNALRVLAISLFFGALYTVQNAILVREMKFKLIFIRGVISSSLAGVVGVLLAINGYGIWALVIHTLLNQILLSLTVFKSVKWIPKFYFSYDSMKDILSFGGKVLLAEIIIYSVQSVRTLSIGKKYSTTELSFYDRGQIYPSTIMRSIYETIANVLLPSFSKQQDDRSMLRESVYEIIPLSLFLTTPIFVGLAAISKSFVLLLLTEKWIEAVPFLVVFSLYQIAYPIQGISKQVLYALNKSNLVLRLEMINSILIIIITLITLRYSPIIVAIGAVVNSYMIAFISLILLKNDLDISVFKIIYSTKMILFYNILLFMIVYSINYLNVSILATFVIQIMVGVLFYCFIARIFNDSNFYKLTSIFNRIIKEKKK